MKNIKNYRKDLHKSETDGERKDIKMSVTERDREICITYISTTKHNKAAENSSEKNTHFFQRLLLYGVKTQNTT